MKSIIQLSVLFCIILGTSSVFAQKGIIRGKVFDKESGQPIMAATVYLDGTTYGVTTDENGFFSISNLEKGSYKLVASFIGFDDLKLDIEVGAGKIVYKNLYLVTSEVQLSETEIVSNKNEERKSQVYISKITVTPKEIKKLPSASGDADIAQYLSVIPGIIVSGDQGGQIYIRGGSPVQNLILLDGVPIYNPFHSIGLFSVFETEAVRNIDVLTGGYNAEYGGRISAVVDIATKDGNKKNLGGLVAVSPFQARAMIEGPIIALKDDKQSSLSFMLTGKYSYLEQTSKALYKYAGDSTGKLPYNYGDLYGKLSWASVNGSKLNVFGFNFTDRVNLENVAQIKWDNFGAGTDFTLIPGGSNLVLGGKVAYSKYNMRLEEFNQDPRFSTIEGYTAGLDFTSYGNKSEVKYGFELNSFRTNFKFRTAYKTTIEEEQNNTEVNGFVKFRKQWGNFIMEPGLRIQYYASLGEFSPEPRIGLKYNITDKIRLKGAAGIYSQNLLSTVNEKDVVNLFVGFLSSPPERFYEPGSITEYVSTKLQKAWHAVFGIEYSLTKELELNVEPYYKKFTHLIGLNRNKTTISSPNYEAETGEAYGIDFSAKYEWKNIYIWATYSHAYVNRFDGTQTYPTVFDRRHNANLLISYTFGKKKGWEASARWNFGTGFPFTRTQGYVGLYDLSQGLDIDILTGNPILTPIYEQKRNAGRLPDYHRLDLSIRYKTEFSKRSRLEVVATLTNAYDRENIFYFDRLRATRVNQLPILPSMSLSYFF